jgi:hypothetical protein
VPEVRVPVARLERWLTNFAERHGETTRCIKEGALEGRAADGSTFRAVPPFGQHHDGPVDVFATSCAPPLRWGVLLVRKGGYAVARLEGAVVVDSKTGQRHVQGRTKAGGQSQQRFARRRDNQARVAYEAAADHAARILRPGEPLVVGGDHAAVQAVLADSRLARAVVVPPFLAVPDPRRSVLEQAVADASAVRVEVVNA